MPPEILVVDDEPLLLRLLEVVLPPYGLAVRTAAGGQQALDLYRRHRDSIGVVLLDLGMPGLDGPQTLARLREIDPDVRFCFMSGYAAGYSPEELRVMGADRVIAKPFRDLGELARTLREAATPRVG
jgi:CheY-like chemotaxis protein